MATIALRTPCCGEWIRVAAQASKIRVLSGHLHVEFDNQDVAHECKPPTKDPRTRAHTKADCWCGMPHRAEDFL